MKRLILLLLALVSSCATMSSGPPMWVEAKHKYVEDDGMICLCEQYPNPDACDTENPHPHVAARR